MLTIREEQLRVFEAVARRAFEDKMVLRVLGEAPPPRDEAVARDLVRMAIRKCLGYGIHLEADMEEFLGLMVKYSPDFETHPETAWAMKLLENEELPGAAKIKILRKRLGGPASPQEVAGQAARA